MREGRPCSVELLNDREDGTPLWNRLSTSPVRDGRGHLTHFVGVLSDVTGHRRLEEQMRQAQKMEVVGQLAGLATVFGIVKQAGSPKGFTTPPAVPGRLPGAGPP